MSANKIKRTSRQVKKVHRFEPQLSDRELTALVHTEQPVYVDDFQFLHDLVDDEIEGLITSSNAFDFKRKKVEFVYDTDENPTFRNIVGAAIQFEYAVKENSQFEARSLESFVDLSNATLHTRRNDPIIPKVHSSVRFANTLLPERMTLAPASQSEVLNKLDDLVREARRIAPNANLQVNYTLTSKDGNANPGVFLRIAINFSVPVANN